MKLMNCQTYVDTAYVSRVDIVECFEATWPEGQEEMEEVAKFHYEIDVQSGSQDDGAADSADPIELDGDVSNRCAL